MTQSYTCKLEEISDFRNQMRVQFWRDFLGNSPSIPPVLYGLHEPRPSLEKDDEQEVFYTTALAQDQADGYVLTGHPVMLQGGEYVMFTYEGLGTGVQEFILTVYGTCMPMLNLTRRKGQDIERYYPGRRCQSGRSPDQPALRIPDSDSPLALQFIQRRGVQM